MMMTLSSTASSSSTTHRTSASRRCSSSSSNFSSSGRGFLKAAAAASREGGAFYFLILSLFRVVVTFSSPSLSLFFLFFSKKGDSFSSCLFFDLFSFWKEKVSKRERSDFWIYIPFRAESGVEFLCVCGSRVVATFFFKNFKLSLCVIIYFWLTLNSFLR